MSTDALAIKNTVRLYIKQKVHVEADKVKDDSLIFKEGFLDTSRG